MAKKTTARKQDVRRSGRASGSKAPASPAKLPPVGRPAASPARSGKKAGAAAKTVGKSPRTIAERVFVEGLVARKEVAEPGTPLGPGMTHQIVGRKRGGSPRVARRRFSLR